MIDHDILEQKRAEFLLAKRETNKWREADKVVKVRYEQALEMEHRLCGELEQIFDQQARELTTPAKSEIDSMILRMFPVDVFMALPEDIGVLLAGVKYSKCDTVCDCAPSGHCEPDDIAEDKE